MFGNHKVILPVMVSILLGILEQSIYACPGCAVSSGENSFNQRFWLLSIMGVLPIVVAIWIIIKVVRLQKNEKNKNIIS